MYKVLSADKDAYLVDRFIDSVETTGSNTGAAASLDLMKLFGETMSGSTPNRELTRLLVHFDLDPIRDLVSTGKIDTNNPSFECRLKLFDVFGGQPTPKNFTVMVHPLSRSFDEGIGRDVVQYGDDDVCNWTSGSIAQGAWVVTGCGAGGHMTGSIDFITTALVNHVTVSMEKTQTFKTGIEDLYVDVTSMVSAALAQVIPDEGFRIALTSSLEADNHTYFVKRFAARGAFNSAKHPQLIVKFDDSVQDDTLDLTFDASGSLFLYNYVQGNLRNITSGSSLTQITGSNSLLLKLQTEISGGFYTLVFTGSQHVLQPYTPVSGVYSASVFLSSNDATLASKLAASGSVNFTPIWGSLDGHVTYLTGSTITVRPPARGPNVQSTKQYYVTVTGFAADVVPNDVVVLRVNIFDKNNPQIKLVKTPIELPGVVIRDVHFSVRDIDTGLSVIPFDTDKNSTRVSSDASGMFFSLDSASLTTGHSYTVDVMLNTNGQQSVYRSTCANFRVNELR